MSASLVPADSSSWNENALDNCINLDSITAGNVTAPSKIPVEAPGLKFIYQPKNVRLIYYYCQIHRTRSNNATPIAISSRSLLITRWQPNFWLESRNESQNKPNIKAKIGLVQVLPYLDLNFKKP